MKKMVKNSKKFINDLYEHIYEKEKTFAGIKYDVDKVHHLFRIYGLSRHSLNNRYNAYIILEKGENFIKRFSDYKYRKFKSSIDLARRLKILFCVRNSK
jgi:hypothetical protein